MKIIQVQCCAFPTGEVVWIDTRDDRFQVSELYKAYWEKHPELKDVRCGGGVVTINMPEEVYNNIPVSQLAYSLIKEVDK